jgi:hypothetical protein
MSNKDKCGKTEEAGGRYILITLNIKRYQEGRNYGNSDQRKLSRC